tara:strand:- start:973 stop:1407 length:435 start_codon:yes stop_codon:yes gene_type:complete
MGIRGQVSIEYLIVTGFVVFLILGILSFSFFYTLNIKEKINNGQLESFARKIVGSAESVYFSGDPSKVTITAYLPDGVQSIELQGNEFVVSYSSAGGNSLISYQFSVPVTSIAGLDQGGGISINEGLKRFEINAVQDGVVIIEG